jgi:hypothetical protein
MEKLFLVHKWYKDMWQAGFGSQSIAWQAMVYFTNTALNFNEFQFISPSHWCILFLCKKSMPFARSLNVFPFFIICFIIHVGLSFVYLWSGDFKLLFVCTQVVACPFQLCFTTRICLLGRTFPDAPLWNTWISSSHLLNNCFFKSYYVPGEARGLVIWSVPW